LYLCASVDLQAYFVPLAAQFLPQLEDFVFFLDGPFVASHVRVDHVDPSLAALARLAVAARSDRLVKLFGDARPLFWLV